MLGVQAGNFGEASVFHFPALPASTAAQSVGGDSFDVAVDALAPRGRLIIIGMMSQYAEGWVQRQYPGIAEKLLWKSATLQVRSMAAQAQFARLLGASCL